MSVLGSKRILLVAISVLIVAAYFVSSHRSVAKVEYSLPEKSTWWIAPSMLATKWGHFADERVDIKDQYWPTGKRALQAVLDQQADIGYAAGPPVAITIHSGKPLLVLAQAMSSRRIVHLLPRIGHVHDWYEHPIGLARGTISEFYLISHLKKIGKFDLYRNGKMTLVDRQRVEANFITLLENTTKSIILFEPFASVVTMGDPASRENASVSGIARKYGISASLMFQWRKQLGMGPAHRIVPITITETPDGLADLAAMTSRPTASRTPTKMESATPAI